MRVLRRPLKWVHAESLGGVAFSEDLKRILMVYLVFEILGSRRGEKYCRVCLKPLKYVKGLFERGTKRDKLSQKCYCNPAKNRAIYLTNSSVLPVIAVYNPILLTCQFLPGLRVVVQYVHLNYGKLVYILRFLAEGAAL
jgi:hypothetical protein